MTDSLYFCASCGDVIHASDHDFPPTEGWEETCGQWLCPKCRQ